MTNQTWSEVWEHVKKNLPEWRAEQPLGVVQADGGRLVMLRRFKAAENEKKLVYLEADGSFVEVVAEDSAGHVTLADGRIV